MTVMPEEETSLSSSDITVYGATGFVGKFVCQYLVDAVIAGDVVSRGDDGENEDEQPFRVTLGGRSKEKLEMIKTMLTDRFTTTTNTASSSKLIIDIFVADCHDTTAVSNMVSRTSVVINCAGPFSVYGTEIVKSCATSGTDYVDITGEVEWASSMRKQFGTLSSKSGSRIINFCGFDSVPSDMSVFAAVQALRDVAENHPPPTAPPPATTTTDDQGPNDDNNNTNTEVNIIQATTWHSCLGLLNGGTLHTALNIPVDWSTCLFARGSDESSFKTLRKVPYFISDPFILSRPAIIKGEDNRDVPEASITTKWTNAAALAEWKNNLPALEGDIGGGAVSVPFFMAVANAKIVLASAAALKYCDAAASKGDNKPLFTYRERFFPMGKTISEKMGLLSIIPAIFFVLILSISMLAFKLPVVGEKFAMWLCPPGKGSPDLFIKNGYGEVYAKVVATPFETGVGTINTATSQLKFKGDPGNLITAQCVVESALCLVLNRREGGLLPPKSHDGFGTPAQLLGNVLLRRLKDNTVRPVIVETKVVSVLES